MTFTLVAKVSCLLTVALLLLAAAPKYRHNLRHKLCLFAVCLAVLLPFLMVQPVLRSQFTLVAPAQTTAVARELDFVSLQTIWMLGVAFVIVRYAIGALYLRWKSRRAAGSGAVRFGDVTSPMVFGLWRPVILMPTEAARWSSPLWAAALAHEQAHIDRFDLWTSVIVVAGQAVYWFHPLMWWVVRVLRAEGEMACDERVLEQGHDRIAYAELLVSTAQSSSDYLLGCQMTGGTMKTRLEQILGWRPQSQSGRAYSWYAASGCVITLLVTAFLAPAMEQQAYKIGGDVLPPKVVQKIEPQYTKEAKLAHIQGTVVLGVVVTESGHAIDVKTLKSLDPGLDAQAIAAVSQWSFTPGTKQGVAVPVEAHIEIQFRLLDD